MRLATLPPVSKFEHLKTSYAGLTAVLEIRFFFSSFFEISLDAQLAPFGLSLNDPLPQKDALGRNRHHV